MALNGFSTCVPSTIGVYRIPGTRRSLAVRREIAPLLIGFAAEFHRLVEPIDVRTLDDWGYVCRRVRGRNTVSFHSGGLAIDLNALRHALGRVGTFTRRQVAIIRALCRKYGLRWGGDYRLRKDEMHFEVIISRAAALALVRRLQAPSTRSRPAPARPAPARPAPAPKPAVGPSGDRVLRQGMSGQDVKNVQHALAVAGYSVLQDGKFGPRTTAALKRFQARRGLGADGVVGPRTWAALRKAVHG